MQDYDDMLPSVQQLMHLALPVALQLPGPQQPAVARCRYFLMGQGAAMQSLYALQAGNCSCKFGLYVGNVTC